MGYRLTPRSMTLDDPELHKFEFSVISEFFTISHVTTVPTINGKSHIVDFFARGLHTRSAVSRLSLRELGFLVCFCYVC